MMHDACSLSRVKIGFFPGLGLLFSSAGPREESVPLCYHIVTTLAHIEYDKIATLNDKEERHSPF